MRAAVHGAVALLCCLGAAHGALFNQTTFLGTGRSPPWWSVVRSDVPALAAKANELQAVLSDSPTFGQVVSGMLGDDAGDATVARTLAYMLNQNLTYGGGCPVPPHSAAFNTLVRGPAPTGRLLTGLDCRPDCADAAGQARLRTVSGCRGAAAHGA